MLANPAGSADTANSVMRRSRAGSGGASGRPVTRRMSSSWVQVSNDLTTSMRSMVVVKPWRVTDRCRAWPSRVAPWAMVPAIRSSQSARVSAGGRPAWDNASAWVDATCV